MDTPKKIDLPCLDQPYSLYYNAFEEDKMLQKGQHTFFQVAL